MANKQKAIGKQLTNVAFFLSKHDAPKATYYAHAIFGFTMLF